jgi:hypothetical protein
LDIGDGGFVHTCGGADHDGVHFLDLAAQGVGRGEGRQHDRFDRRSDDGDGVGRAENTHHPCPQSQPGARRQPRGPGLVGPAGHDAKTPPRMLVRFCARPRKKIAPDRRVIGFYHPGSEYT